MIGGSILSVVWTAIYQRSMCWHSSTLLLLIVTSHEPMGATLEGTRMKDLLKSSRHNRAQIILTGFRYLIAKFINWRRTSEIVIRSKALVRKTIEFFALVVSFFSYNSYRYFIFFLACWHLEQNQIYNPFINLFMNHDYILSPWTNFTSPLWTS